MASIIVQQLRQEVSYDPATGGFRWLKRLNGRRFDKPVGCLRKNDGYLQFRVLGSPHLSHRLAWLYVHGTWPQGEIDHINGRRDDNRIANLRDVEKIVNRQNLRRPRKDNKLSVQGVYRHQRNGNFVARIGVDGVKRHLGCFDSEGDAAAAYVAAKRQLHEGCTL